MYVPQTYIDRNAKLFDHMLNFDFDLFLGNFHFLNASLIGEEDNPVIVLVKIF